MVIWVQWSVIFHPAVAAWLETLDSSTYQQVIAALRELRGQGPALGRPLADTVRGSRHRNMKELRPGSSARSEIRILFVFDPRRQAILLVAGTRPAGGSDGTSGQSRLLMTDLTNISSC
jgi:hypothetical protein